MATRRELANAIRALAIDAIETSKSGHPGAPMGMADMAEALWRHVLRHNPANPHWANRDRFVLSNGHASMLLYALLHLTGYDLSLDDIKAFRQLGSKTPGHPEYGHTPGVETTTGPLGQGIATAVGMALAEKILATRFNHEGHSIVDHHTYTFLGDGCMMEGISHEACSLAGTLGLGKLIALYDANGISIDGSIDGWFAEDVAARFEAYGWQVIPAVDGHDCVQLDLALAAAKLETAKPTLIICRTHIGFGSPNKVDSAKVHGSPLGEDEARAAKAALGWNAAPFEISADIYKGWNANIAGAQAEAAWNAEFAAYAKAYPEDAAEFTRRMSGALPQGWAETIASVIAEANSKAESIASRIANKKTLEALAPCLPELLGGSADLSGSVGTVTSLSRTITPDDFSGNYISYGVREFGMSAIMNGMTLHGGLIPYAGTFLMFSDYAKNALRLAALMGIRVLHVLTHDSIGVGEDGPTHQPVEQVPGLRLTPNLALWRPCDTVETAVAWKCALEDTTRPSCFSLSRQNLPFMPRTEAQIAAIEKGGYILRNCAGQPDIILIATGSEVGLAVASAAALTEQGRKVRVVSMPCTSVFDAQPASYRESVLPKSCRARVAIEAAAADYWGKYVGLDGAVVGMTSFGASAPGAVLQKHFGFTVEHVLEVAQSILP